MGLVYHLLARMVDMLGAMAMMSQDAQIGAHANKLVFLGPNIDWNIVLSTQMFIVLMKYTMIVLHYVVGFTINLSIFSRFFYVFIKRPIVVGEHKTFKMSLKNNF